MERSIATRLRHRLVSYALVAALSLGATIAPSVSEAGSPQERKEGVGKSDPKTEGHGGLIVHWFAAANEETDAGRSAFQNWLADVYDQLIGLKAAITSALPHEWKWGHDKSGKVCR